MKSKTTHFVNQIDFHKYAICCVVNDEALKVTF